MGHRSWTASFIGDPVTEISRPESETTKCTHLLWPARRIAANTPSITASKSDGVGIIAYPSGRQDHGPLGYGNLLPLVQQIGSWIPRDMHRWKKIVLLTGITSGVRRHR